MKITKSPSLSSDPKPKKNQYKEKFLVPGSTVNRHEFFEKYCHGHCTKAKAPYPNHCYGIGDLLREEELETCIHKDSLYSSYVVGHKHDGTWTCSCKGWIFKYRKLGEECDHIRKARKDPEKYRMAVENTSGTVNVLKDLLG